jgi:tRNA/rRNA methyltransferase
MAFLFGSERFGMKNEDAHRMPCGTLRIPTDPSFGSLNLASAVQVVAYEWRLALGGYAVQAATTPPQPCRCRRRWPVCCSTWEQSLVDIGFLDPQALKKLMPRLNELFNRARFERGRSPYPAWDCQGHEPVGQGKKLDSLYVFKNPR